MEARIVSGLKRTATGRLLAGAGPGRDRGAAVLRLAALAGAVASWARRCGRRLARWAQRRSVSPNSVAGISLLLAICASVWFSAGTAASARSLAAMAGWLVALAAGRKLAAIAPSEQPEPPGAARRAKGAARAGEEGTDWLVLPGMAWDDGGTRARGPDGEVQGDLVAASGFRWIATLCAVAAECAIYGGIAAGGEAGLPIRLWPLAAATTSSVAVTALLAAGREAAVAAGRCRPAARDPAVRRRVGRLLRPPVGARALLAAGGYVFGGPAVALLAVLSAEAIAIAATLAMLPKIASRPRRPAPVEPPRRPAKRPWQPSGITIIGVTGPHGETAAVKVRTAGGDRQAEVPADEDRPDPEAGSSENVEAIADPGQAGPAGALDVVLALRDDGAAARWAGRLVQGTLIPFPPAFSGLMATAMLAALGLRDLPGFIALTPPVVMMLAAPGSSHPHDGRLDWLVPALLAAAQFVYLTWLGFALAVPGPAVFAGCAMTALWYASIIAEAGGARPGAGKEAVGWETRMFAVGLAATFGLATFGYLGLAAYLGVLICRKVMAGYLIAWEEDSR